MQVHHIKPKVGSAITINRKDFLSGKYAQDIEHLLVERSADRDQLLVLQPFGALQGDFHQIRGGLQTGAVQIEKLGLRLGHRSSPS